MKKNKLSMFAMIAVMIATFSFGGSISAAGAETDLSAFSNSIVMFIGSPNTLERGKAKQVDTNAAVVPYIDNGRTMIPLSYVGTSLGFKVGWYEDTKKILLEKESLTLEFTLNSRTMKENGKAVFMDAAAVSKNGRTLVPVAYVAKALGMKVSYDRGLVILDPTREFTQANDKDLINAAIAALAGFPLVGSAEKLAELIEGMAVSQQIYYGTDEELKTNAPLAETPMAAATSAPMAADSVSRESAAGGTSDYSKTNVQVAGVDEADVVKTDGEFIYHLSNNMLRISKVYPLGEMKLLSELSFAGASGSGYATEMYVDGDRLIVMSSDYVNIVENTSSTNAASDTAAKSIMPTQGRQLAKVSIFNIKDRTKPVIERVFSIEGYALSSRKIGDTLYLIANQNTSYYTYENDEDYVPMYFDSLKGKDGIKIDVSSMQYFPNAVDPSIMMIVGLDISDSKKEANIASFLGSGSNVYMSENALYITKYDYYYSFSRGLDTKVVDYTNKTGVFRFILETGTGGVIASGSALVDGNVLNQFSMDEYNGYFRIATTVNASTGTKNALTILDSSMTECGKINDMAPGERIYSARFMGDRAFMVTYRQVDPLFAMDLSNPKSPKVIGELKIPGYSTYLHPYDENHLIGFGQDTEVITSYTASGAVYDQRTINSSLKLALFDISDMTNPKEKSVVKIGNQYTYSELLYNHKAFLFSKEKGIIAFPVQTPDYTDLNGKYNDGFQGAYVFNISDSAITTKGTITQIDDEMDFYSQYSNYIERVLFIGDTLYSTSQSGIQANDLKTLGKVGYITYN